MYLGFLKYRYHSGKSVISAIKFSSTETQLKNENNIIESHFQRMAIWGCYFKKVIPGTLLLKWKQRERHSVLCINIKISSHDFITMFSMNASDTFNAQVKCYKTLEGKK